MSTFGTMIDRIQNEILRTDINSNVQDAIKSAIRAYEGVRFVFNEGDNAADSWTTGASNTATYTLSNEWIDVDLITITVSSNEYPLIKRTFDWYKEVNTNPATVVGVPTDFAYHNDRIWLYPSPNQAYVLKVYGHRKVTALDSNGELTLTNTLVSNEWFREAEGVIRNRAKYYLYADVLENPERAAFYGGLDPLTGIARGREGEELRVLETRVNKKKTTGFLQPEKF